MADLLKQRKKQSGNKIHQKSTANWQITAYTRYGSTSDKTTNPNITTMALKRGVEPGEEFIQWKQPKKRPPGVVFHVEGLRSGTTVCGKVLFWHWQH